MEEALRSLIVGNAGVAALVGNRVYWGQAPQSVNADFINLYVVSGLREYTMAGVDGLRATRVQVDCWSSKYSTAKQLSRAVATAISGYKGTPTGATFQGVFIDTERDFNGPDVGETVTRFRTSFDLEIWHS